MKKIYCTLVTILFLCANIKATDYYLKTSGSFNLAASWGTTAAGNGVGDTPANFNGATHVWHFANRASVSVSSTFAAVAGSTVIIESGINLTYILNGAFNTNVD